MNKRAEGTGESILNIFRIVLISFVALAILGVFAFFYDYSIDVMDIEAQILAKQIINCIASDGNIYFNNQEMINHKDKILDYCKIPFNERFYVKIEAKDNENNELKLEQGDSGLLWIKDAFDSAAGTSGKYNPGYFNQEFFVTVVGNEKISGKINVEVLVKA